MNMNTNTGARNAYNWRSISIGATPGGYSVIEANAKFVPEIVAENALRLVAVLMILAGCVQWFLPGTLFPDHPISSRLLLTVLFVSDTTNFQTPIPLPSGKALTRARRSPIGVLPLVPFS